MNLLKNIRTIIHVFVTILIILYLLTGLGITNYQLIQTITFGGLSKPTAYQLHSILLIPFIIILALHIILTMVYKHQKRNIKVG